MLHGRSRDPAPLAAFLRRSAPWVLATYALVALTFVVPWLNSLAPPFVDLAGPIGVAAYWIAESSGTLGAPVVCAIMIALAVSRAGLTSRQRLTEAGLMAVVLAVVLGGGVYLNEHVIKPAFHVPRPNIVELATMPADAPALKISAEAFYDLPGKRERSEYLSGVLLAEGFDAVSMHPLIRRHWIAETGYSFPSGHAFASWTIATFFLAIGLGFAPTKSASGRNFMWAVYILLPWAVLVCYSRTILRVHSPADVCAGAAEGILFGLISFVLFRWLGRLLERQATIG